MLLTFNKDKIRKIYHNNLFYNINIKNIMQYFSIGGVKDLQNRLPLYFT